MTKLAAVTDLGTIGGPPAGGFGPWGNIAAAGSGVAEAARIFTFTLSRIIGILTIIAGIWFIFNFIIGAFGFLTAGGSEEGIKKATAKIGQSILGLVVVVAAYAVISLLGALLGFEILNPQDIIPKLGP